MNIKIDNMIDLRAFCLEQAVKGQEYPPHGFISIAKQYEVYILGGVKRPDQPFNSSELLDTMTDMIKANEIK